VFKGVIVKLDSEYNSQYEGLILKVDEILGVGGRIEYANFVAPSNPFNFSSASLDLFTCTVDKSEVFYAILWGLRDGLT